MLALSATLGDMNAAAQWLSSDEKERITIISDEHEEKTVKYRIHGYISRKESKPPEENPDSESAASSAEERMVDDIYNAFKGKTALIFGNSKAKLEFLADRVMRKAEESRMPHHFGIHHGSLSKEIREEIENDLRSEKAFAVFCSSTMEMGIDVGNVSLTGQIGTPWSVNSLAQRIGRSGRKEGRAAIMRMYIDEFETDENSRIFDRFYPGLVEAVALSELMLEGWSEPPVSDRLHISCLVHQILSVITELNGSRADRIFERLIEKGSFKEVDNQLFIRILKSMGAGDLIEQTPEGVLILGLAGEKMVRSHDFYSVFKAEDEYRVVSNGATIGKVGLNPGLVMGSYFILAGQRWRILGKDTSTREVLVERSGGGQLPFFPVCSGLDVHPRVRDKMREILLEDVIPPYLDDTAKTMLQQARELASDLNLAENRFIQDGTDLSWFTWTGSQINRTLLIYGVNFGGLDIREEEFGLVIKKAGPDEVEAVFRKIMEASPDPTEVAKKGKFTALEKFDILLAEDLQSEIYVRNHLDLEGTLSYLEKELK